MTDEEIPAGEAAETEPKTIAEVENLDEYEKWETEEGSSGQTMYVKQTGSEKQYISDDFYLTLGEYEGYWTLDGQELHFQGKDLEILKLTDLEGHPIPMPSGIFPIIFTGKFPDQKKIKIFKTQKNYEGT